MDEQKAIEIITNEVQTDSMTAETDKALAVIQRAAEKQVAKSLVAVSYTHLTLPTTPYV